MKFRASWRDVADAPVRRPDVPGRDEPAFYTPIGAFQRETYERNAFTKHTDHEVTWLTDRLDITPGMRLLDVGCGTGRHVRQFAAHGVATVGVDVSTELVAAGRELAGNTTAQFVVGDAATVLNDVLERASFDRVISLHQGAMGIAPELDAEVVAGIARVLKPGGTCAITFFHALFAARHLVDGDAYDTMNGVHHQRAEVHGPDGARQRFDLWTTAYTVREAVQLCQHAALQVRDVRGVEPGAFAKRETFTVGLDDPEFVVIATR